MMLTNYYFPSSTRDLVVVNEQLNKNFTREEQDLFPTGPNGARGLVDGSDEEVELQPPKAIEYQGNPHSEGEEGERMEKNENKFFITEDEILLRGGNPTQKRGQTVPETVQEDEEYENQHPNAMVNTAAGGSDEILEDIGYRKMEHFKSQCRAILGPSKRHPKSN
jgi:hypothetical protein